MGIRHRALDGAKERTPWAYLSSAQMFSTLERKNEIINALKLKSLAASRMLGVRNRHIDGWKRLAIAISTENIPRIKTLMATAQRAGDSVFSILDRIKKTAQRIYSPKGYAETDYQLTYLIYKIGGRAAANIAHRALGIPSIDSSKRHVAMSPLISSSKFPTAAELQSNVLTCYGNALAGAPDSGMLATHTLTGRRVKGMTMQVDELKIQERLRWDPTSNEILGVCREHTSNREHPLSLEFRSLHQADALLAGLQANKVHLATEVSDLSLRLNNPVYLTEIVGNRDRFFNTLRRSK